MRARKTGWKSTTLIIITAFLISLTGILYGHESSSDKQNIALTANTTSASPQWHAVTVKRGDTLASLCYGLKINPADVLLIAKAHKGITDLHPGDVLHFQVQPPHTLTAMKYPLDRTKILLISRQGENKFSSRIIKKPTTTVLAFKSTTIHSSLAQAAKAAGISPKMVHQLQSIFGGSVNFARDIRRGDRVAFLYQELYIDGKQYRDGNIVAAEFIHRDHAYKAIRYTYPVEHTGYYTPDGHGVEARYLRAPVHYKRISSRFRLHRLDPVIHKVRPHLGIDYAARKGTPIKSIGDGRVIFMGRDGGYGKAIRIRYNRHDVALYGHMWHFAKNIHLHQRVHKGQVIGYVGETGWATGPHLHFGFYVNGRPRNWLAMKLPTEKSIPRSYEKHFIADAKSLLAKLALYQDTQLAENDTKITKHSTTNSFTN